MSGRLRPSDDGWPRTPNEERVGLEAEIWQPAHSWDSTSTPTSSLGSGNCEVPSSCVLAVHLSPSRYAVATVGDTLPAHSRRSVSLGKQLLNNKHPGGEPDARCPDTAHRPDRDQRAGLRRLLPAPPAARHAARIHRTECRCAGRLGGPGRCRGRCRRRPGAVRRPVDRPAPLVGDLPAGGGLFLCQPRPRTDLRTAAGTPLAGARRCAPWSW